MFTCPICLEDDNSNCFTTDCKHDFHINCIQQWCFSSVVTERFHTARVSCPVCRSDIQRMPDEDRVHDYLRRFVMGMRPSRLKRACMRLFFLGSFDAKERAFLQAADCFDEIQSLPEDDVFKFHVLFAFFQMQSFSRRGRGIVEL